MVEKIEIQKGFAPLSSTAKVRNVKKQNNNMQQRRFERELQEEESKKRSKGKHTFDDQEISDEKLVSRQIPGPDSIENQETDIKNKTGNKGNIQGKLIDIVV
jgi:hypothetical protein